MINSRLARRGGVKRISAGIYEETRESIKKHLGTVCTLPLYVIVGLVLTVADNARRCHDR